LIIVDDGSSDETPTILQSFSDRRIRLISQSNKGQCAASNVGLEHSSGDYVLFLDADDYLERDAIQILLTLQREKSGLEIIFSAWETCVGCQSTLTCRAADEQDLKQYELDREPWRIVANCFRLDFWVIAPSLFRSTSLRSVDTTSDYRWTTTMRILPRCCYRQMSFAFARRQCPSIA